jgi:hypothetical protein
MISVSGLYKLVQGGKGKTILGDQDINGRIMLQQIPEEQSYIVTNIVLVHKRAQHLVQPYNYCHFNKKIKNGSISFLRVVSSRAFQRNDSQFKVILNGT